MSISEKQALLARITADRDIAGGKPVVKGTRVLVATLLDGLAEGLSEQQLIDHYPQLVHDDIRAALVYAGELAQENTWKLAI